MSRQPVTRPQWPEPRPRTNPPARTARPAARRAWGPSTRWRTTGSFSGYAGYFFRLLAPGPTVIGSWGGPAPASWNGSGADLGASLSPTDQALAPASTAERRSCPPQRAQDGGESSVVLLCQFRAGRTPLVLFSEAGGLLIGELGRGSTPSLLTAAPPRARAEDRQGRGRRSLQRAGNGLQPLFQDRVPARNSIDLAAEVTEDSLQFGHFQFLRCRR